MNHKCYHRETDNKFKEFCRLTGLERDCEECGEFENMVDKIGRDTFMGKVLSDKIGEKNERKN